MEGESSARKSHIATANIFHLFLQNNGEQVEQTGLNDPNFKNEVIGIMRDVDNETLPAILNDPIILRVGFHYYQENCFSDRRSDRETLRILGRLLVQYRKNEHKGDLSLFDIIKENNMHKVLEAAKDVAGYDMHTREFKSPSTAKRCGEAYQKALLQAIYMLTYEERFKDISKARDLEFLLRTNYTFWRKLRVPADIMLERKKINIPKVVPRTDDLQKLKVWLDGKAAALRKSLNDGKVDEYVWGSFEKVLLVKVFVFNKKRQAEPGNLTVDQFKNPPNWDTETTQESLAELTQLERELKSKFKIFKVKGKRYNKSVPLLLDQQMEEDINLLLKYRPLYINEKNPFVFAARKNSLRSVSACVALKEEVDKMGNELKCPEAITGTNLRKYFAIIMQLFDLTSNELELVMKFLGK